MLSSPCPILVLVLILILVLVPILVSILVLVLVLVFVLVLPLLLPLALVPPRLLLLLPPPPPHLRDRKAKRLAKLHPRGGGVGHDGSKPLRRRPRLGRIFIGNLD